MIAAVARAGLEGSGSRYAAMLERMDPAEIAQLGTRL